MSAPEDVRRHQRFGPIEPAGEPPRQGPDIAQGILEGLAAGMGLGLLVYQAFFR